MSFGHEYPSRWPDPKRKRARSVWITSCIECGHPTAVCEGRERPTHERTHKNACPYHPIGKLTSARYVEIGAVGRMLLEL